jgi:transcriptional antiterminator RfaH
MKRWFVAHTHANAELKAAQHLNRQNFEIYLPRYLKVRSHARKRELVQAPFFPRYLFIHLDVERDRWRAVRSTVGVSDILCNGETPMPVPDDIIVDLRAREDDNGNVRVNKVVPFKAGDRVRILMGSFAEQMGIFDCETDAERVRVLLQLLGRTVKIQLPVDAIGAPA